LLGLNSAVNIRRKITQNPYPGDMSIGGLRWPGALVFNQTLVRFSPNKRGNCKP